ncbi:hypothetical protein Zm00014a_031761 [Zea mays]|uniref:Uncharacterized protein n=1 Tax=Zea mays TaxID=4577 RepID=A0A317Y4I7_MAIZE|nr:hypothetical protein Zm00014a_031761 [Zea mays]
MEPDRVSPVLIASLCCLFARD